MAIKKINTDLQIEAGLLDGDGNSGNSNQILISTGTGIDWVDGSGSSIIGGPYLPLSAGSSYPLTGILYLANVGSDQKIQFQRTGGNVYSIEHDSAQLYFYNRTTTEAPLVIQNDGDVLMNAGNVGIGTTNPYGKLHVLDSATGAAGMTVHNNLEATGNSAALWFKVASSTADYRKGAVLFVNNGTGYGRGDFYFASNTSTSSTSIASTSDAKMVIKGATGNVGIGTTSPETNLMIYDTVSEDPAEPGFATTGMFALNKSGQATLSMGVGANNTFWMSNVNRAFTGPYYYNISLNPLGGNVGIGTTDPSEKLEVYDGNIKLTDGTRSLLIGEEGGSSYQINSSGYLIVNATSGIQINKTTSGNVTIASGNVGIGTTNPQAQLQIDTPEDNGEGQGLRINRPSAGTHYHSVEFATNGNIDWSIGQNNNDAFQVYEDGLAVLTRFTIKEGGNVGIGTTDPGAKLHLYTGDLGGNTGVTDMLRIELNRSDHGATPSGPAILFKDQDTNNLTNEARIKMMTVNDTDYGDNDEAASNLLFETTNNGVASDKMIITGRGNVGIGTTNPSLKLHVSHPDDNNGLLLENTNNVNNYQILQNIRENEGLIWQRWINGSFNSNLMTLDYSGNVGIGTTSPKTSLDIVKDADIWHFMVGGATKKLLVGGQAASGDVVLQAGAASTLNNAAVTTPYNLCLQRDGGNVGIGETSPGAKLDVEGDVLIKAANLSNQENTDVDTGTEVVATVAIATYTAAFFDFVIKNGTNVRSGTVFACHDGTNVEFTETSTADLGNTSPLTLSVDISAGNMRLLATATTDNWSVKSLVRAL
jgi:hypothetical protein